MLYDEFKSKYMGEDDFQKKFPVSNFDTFKMVDSRPLVDKFHEIQKTLGRFKQHNLIMDGLLLFHL